MELKTTFDYAIADFTDALAFEQEMVIRKIDRSVTRLIELLHFSQNVFS